MSIISDILNLKYCTYQYTIGLNECVKSQSILIFDTSLSLSLSLSTPRPLLSSLFCPLSLTFFNYLYQSSEVVPDEVIVKSQAEGLEDCRLQSTS